MIQSKAMRPVLFFFLALLVLPLNANPMFSGFTAEYEVSRNDMVLGVSKRRLVSREHGTKLDYASTTIPQGLVALFISDRFMEHSLIHVTPSGLQPRRYEYQRTGGKKEITFQANFDWRNKQIQVTGNEQAQEMLPNTQDLLSFQLALMQGLYEGKREFHFQIVDHKRTQLQSLVYSRTEQVRSSLGKLDLLQLEHKANKSNYRFTFWCAKQLNYLPVKIRKIEHDGDVILLKLKHLDKEKFHLFDQAADDSEES